MQEIAKTPNPPYYAVIFTSLRTADDEGYEEMARKMLELASKQPGFLGAETARDKLGLTVSYWQDHESIKRWKTNLEHQQAQKLGREKWYSSFKIRICRVDLDYGM